MPKPDHERPGYVEDTDGKMRRIADILGWSPDGNTRDHLVEGANMLLFMAAQSFALTAGLGDGWETIERLCDRMGAAVKDELSAIVGELTESN